jgi:hypothetical protein
MECSLATPISTPPKKMWMGKDEAAMTSFSLRFAYAWICSVLASVSTSKYIFILLGLNYANLIIMQYNQKQTPVDSYRLCLNKNPPSQANIDII